MVTICILVGLGLLVFCGIVMAYTTEDEEDSNTPPLPPRVNAVVPSPTVTQTQIRTNSSSATKELPPRRSSAPAAASAIQRTGPRGIHCTQFPCCPLCKQRNTPGKGQLVFWDSGRSCYRCSRGHAFQQNGKPL